jgi:hypothetical protein
MAGGFRGGGDDIIFGWQGQTIKAGEIFDSAAHDDAVAQWDRYKADYQAWVDGGKIGDEPDQPLVNINTGIAADDMHMVVDGGNGNDWIIAIKGDEVTTVGGAGRDWIYNTSKGGVIYGDTIDGLDPDTHISIAAEEASGNDLDAGHHKFSDEFWWSPNTTIMDAGHYDVLKFFGIPLVGGDSGGGVTISLATAGLSQTAGSVQTGKSIYSTVFVDEFLPFITYKLDYVDGHIDLLVANVFSAFLDAASAILGGSNSNLDKLIKQDLGIMRIKNFDFVASYYGSQQEGLAGHGTLGMVFKLANPIYAILAHLPETLITFAASGGGALVDEAFTALAAANRFAKAMKWSSGADPLVLDLAGDGISTKSLDGSTVHFDLNNDFFAERTGWLDGSDGFLVFDRNGNGLIDDASEMFGTNTGSGFEDLAAFDSNHDGVIDSRDAMFSQLQVWTDTNGDGITEAGELHSLSDLGIASISLASTEIDATTPQGTTLRSWASFTRTDGTTSSIYEALFETDQTDTVYRGKGSRQLGSGGFDRCQGLWPPHEPSSILCKRFRSWRFGGCTYGGNDHRRPPHACGAGWRCPGDVGRDPQPHSRTHARPAVGRWQDVDRPRSLR